MPAQETIYKIFIASPSGLNPERKAFAKIIEEYNKSDAQYRGVSFRAVGWEDTLPGMGRPQALINEDLEQCDFFILLLHNRWGSNPGKNVENATSGTEEEFRLARKCYDDENAHMKQIVCAFKSISAEQLADPGKQLEKVLDFKKELDESKELLYSSFYSIEEFKSIIRKQLGRWLRNHENETKGNGKIQDNLPIIPEVAIPISEEEVSIPTTEKDTKEIIENALMLAKNGKLTEAEIEFSKAIIYSPNSYELLNYVKFLMDIGQLDKALMILGEVLEDENVALEYISSTYVFLGVINKTRGNLDLSQSMYEKSLKINEQIGDEEGMAADYRNLGIVMKTHGDLEGAELMYKKSLEINEQLGHKEGMAANYGNLGIIKAKRDDLEGAELMFKKSLEINEQLGRKEGMAYQYGNLGVLMKMRNDLNSAELMLKKSLEINKQLGRKENISKDYGNLGNIMLERNDLDGAKSMYKRSLEINEQLGRKEGIANQYGNLGIVMKLSDDLEGAELMYKKSIEIAEKHGFAEIIHKVKDNLKKLREK